MSSANGRPARNRVEDGLDYPLGKNRPAAGRTIEIASGVHWLRMPLPFQLDHINLWLLEDGDGYAIVDTGLQLDETKEHWLEIFRRFGIAHGGKAGKPVTRLIVTHFHPDHMGLAGWLNDLLDTELWITRTEWLMARMLYLDSDAVNHRSMAKFYALHGLAPDLADRMFSSGNTYRRRVAEAPFHHRRLCAGDVLEIGGRRWEIIVGTGHAPEHACLWTAGDGILISGDQILPKITPNISVWASEPDASPLEDYLGSFANFAGLPDDALVLPSHNLPFRGVQTRIGQIVDHHRVRLERLSGGFAGGSGRARLSAADAVPLLFRREIDFHQMGFAMGECLAHLAYLEGEGTLTGRLDPDGIHRFERT
ncbi:MAG: MBL fold metallo-hydrolase [Rhodospirillaceae bacterium]|nr:MBL fold metallo-hydrolase [Rhodospirillaceae bacterium]